MLCFVALATKTSPSPSLICRIHAFWFAQFWQTQTAALGSLRSLFSPNNALRSPPHTRCLQVAYRPGTSFAPYIPCVCLWGLCTCRMWGSLVCNSCIRVVPDRSHFISGSLACKAFIFYIENPQFVFIASLYVFVSCSFHFQRPNTALHRDNCQLEQCVQYESITNRLDQNK